MRTNARLDEQWSGHFVLEDDEGQPAAKLILATLEKPGFPGEGEGYVYLGSPVNMTPDLLLTVEPPPPADPLTLCAPLPLNFVALPGAMPMWLLSSEDCEEDDTAPPVPFYSTTGESWGGFDEPRHYRLDQWNANRVEVLMEDLENLGSVPPGLAESTVAMFLDNTLLNPTTETLWTVQVCPDFAISTTGGLDLTELMTLDGEDIPDCSGEGPAGEGWSFVRTEEGLNCNLAWDR